MSTRIRALENHYGRISRVYSKTHGVKIMMAGVGAPCTNGDVIMIPANADFLDEEKQHVLDGLIDHETGHILGRRHAQEHGHEDPYSVLKRVLKREPHLQGFLNTFEDVRCELLMEEGHPGIRENFEHLRAQSVDTVTGRVAVAEETCEAIKELAQLIPGASPQQMNGSQKVDLWWLVQATIYFKARGADISSLPSQVKELVEGPLASFVERVQHLESCEASLELAREAYDALKELSKKEDPPPPEETVPGGEQQGGGEGDGDGDSDQSDMDSGNPNTPKSQAPQEPGENDTDADAGKDNQDGDKGESGASAPSGSNEDEPGEDEADRGGAGNVGEQTGPASPKDGGKNMPSAPADDDSEGESKDSNDKGNPIRDLARALTNKAPSGSLDQFEELAKRLKEAAVADAKGRHIPHPKALELDTHIFVTREMRSEFERLRRETSNAANTLRARILQVLRSRMRNVWKGDLPAGVLDSRTLYSVRMGGKRVFAEKQMGQKVDCSIAILVDESGSMGFSKKQYRAQQAVVALGECLSKVRGIEFAVMGFDTDEEITIWGPTRSQWGSPNRGSWPRWVHNAPSGSEDAAFNRFCGQRYRTYKRWDESWNKARYRIPTMRAGCTNVDCEAVMWAGKQTAVRTSERKILMVLSDGLPNSNWSNDRQNDALREVVERLVKAGVEVVAVGIESAHVKDYYPDAIVIHHVDEMPPQLLKLLERYLVKKVAKLAG